MKYRYTFCNNNEDTNTGCEYIFFFKKSQAKFLMCQVSLFQQQLKLLLSRIEILRVQTKTHVAKKSWHT